MTEPEHPSPLIAELYRWWYRQRQIRSNRLFVDSFSIIEPHWTLRTGSVPFWLKFNMAPSLNWLEQYLESTDPDDEIYLTPFSHGTESIGFVPIERWRKVLERARDHGDIIGVDEEKFPRDFGVFVRYYTDLKEKLPSRYPLPGTMPPRQIKSFLEQNQDRSLVRCIDHAVERRVTTGEQLALVG